MHDDSVLEEQHAIVCVFVNTRFSCKDIYKEMFPVCGEKQCTNGLINSLKDASNVVDEYQLGCPVEIAMELTGNT